MNIKKKKKLPTREELLTRIEQYKKHYKNLIKNRIFLHEAYDDNFKRIEESEKQSREHLKLLVIENALNEQSLKFVTAIDEIPNTIRNIRKKISEKKYRKEKPQ